MSYNDEHEKWLNSHYKKRRGSRLDALKRGHGYGNQLFLEKVWWSIFGDLNYIHPEYEILDFRGNPFYADFMWKQGSVKIFFEIQDFGSHVQNMDRQGYRRELNRGLFMQSLQFKIIYIALDELKENPSLVLSMIKTILSPYFVLSNAASPNYSRIELDILRLISRHNRVLRPGVAARELGVNKNIITKHMKILVQKGKLRAIPSGKSGRITSYELIGSLTDLAPF